MNANPVVIPIKPAGKEPLAQVEVLLTFHPALQTGGPRNVAIPVNAMHGYMTVDVYGRRGTSEFTGLPILEDSRFEVNGEDIEDKLPDNIIQGIVEYVLND